MPFGAADVFGDGQDPALPVGSSRVVDATGTPGDVVVGSGVREIKVLQVIGQSELLITHPDITLSAHVVGSSAGQSSSSPEAVRRQNYRVVAGGIVVGISGGAVLADGPQTVSVRVI